jgi:hypothetical protein
MMKLADKTVEIHSRGVTTTNQFSIQQSAKMFNILSNSLYSDKVMAVIRELSTNAYDSHIASNNPEPFHVQLPTSTEPTFRVRDYGTGLSQADMEELYTTYGASNKNTSNDFVGCLGLGSKSPFAYTKSFTTSSYFNGQQFMYVASMDETGVPSLNLLGVFDTTEPNGLEVSFAVKNEDVEEFRKTAKRVFHYFKNKPTLSGSLQDHSYSHREVSVSGESWRVCKLSGDHSRFPNHYHHNGGIVAIMGNIAYPVKISHILGEKEEQDNSVARWNKTFKKSDHESWKEFLQDILSRGQYIELDFGIGELEMDPARENLQYTKEVIRTLRQKTQEVYLEMKKTLSEKLKTAKTKIEAIQTYNTLGEVTGGWGTGADWTDADGNVHHIKHNQDLEYKLKNKACMYAIGYKTATYRSRRYVYQTHTVFYPTIVGAPSYHSYTHTRKTGDLKFFVCDVKSEESAKKIAIKYCNQNDCYAYLLVNTIDHTNVESEFSDLIKDVGQENLLKISDYKHLARGTRKSSGGTGKAISNDDIFLVRLKHTEQKGEGLDANLNDAWTLVTFDVDELEEGEDIIYVPITRYASNEGFMSLSEIHNNEGLHKTLIAGNFVYAIKTSSVKKFKDYNLIPHNEYMKDAFESELEKIGREYAEVKELIGFSREHSPLSNSYGNGDSDKDSAAHLLWGLKNLFSIHYDKYLNKAMTSSLDMLLLYNSLNYYSEGYDAKNNQTLKKIGCSKTMEEIRELINKDVEYTKFAEQNSCENAYHDVVQKNLKKYSLPSHQKLVSVLKTEVDKSPLVKYNVGVAWSNVSAESHVEEVDPVKVGTSYWNKNSWAHNMSADEVEVLRVSLGNTIL